MTANEKAGTFIEWTGSQPDMHSSSLYIPAMHSIVKGGAYTFWLTKHGWMVLYLGAPWPQDPHPLQTFDVVKLLAFIYDDIQRRNNAQ